MSRSIYANENEKPQTLRIKNALSRMIDSSAAELLYSCKSVTRYKNGTSVAFNLRAALYTEPSEARLHASFGLSCDRILPFSLAWFRFMLFYVLHIFRGAFLLPGYIICWASGCP